MERPPSLYTPSYSVSTQGATSPVVPNKELETPEVKVDVVESVVAEVRICVIEAG